MILQSCIVLLIILVPVFGELTFEELDNVWEKPSLKIEIASALTNCLHEEHDNRENFVEESVTFCDRALFLNKFVNLHDQFDETKNLLQHSHDWKDEGIILKEDISFQDFFHEHSVVVNPLIITGNFSQSQDFMHSIAECIPIQWELVLNLEHKDKIHEYPLIQTPSCQTSLASLSVNRYVANNYFQRLEKRTFKTRWPTVFWAGEEAVAKLHTCPLKQHMFIEVLLGKIAGKVYGPDRAPFLDPQFQFVKTEDGYDLSELPRLTADIFSDDSLPGSKFEVSQGMLLFVPAGHYASWKVSRKTNETERQGVLLLQYCYADASNLMAVKAAIQTAALVDLKAKELWKELSNPSLDLSMVRQPTNLLHKDYAMWPREAEPSVSEPTRSRGDRTRFKNWQDEKTWKWRIAQLTLPHLPAPEFDPKHREAFVTFLSAYQKPDTDDSIISYNISWFVNDPVPSDPDEVHYILFPEKQLERHPSHAFGYGVAAFQYRARLTVLKPNTSYTFQVAVVHGDVCGPMSPSSKARRTPVLEAPGTVNNVSGDSSQSPTSISICWEQPNADGGDEIKEYHVMKKHIDIHAFEDWIFVGSFPSSALQRQCATVVHLLPNASYIFKVAAANSIGVGPWSMQSPRCSTSAGTGSSTTLYGRGWHEAVHLTQFRHHFEAPPNIGEFQSHMLVNYEVHGPIVSLHDHSSTISVHTSGAENFPAWTCHWSSNSFSVTAEAVYAEPQDASTKLLNQIVTHKRIVLVDRGGVPIVQKVLNAQAAGALGVVIVDDGRCNTFDQNCVMGADQGRNERFAQFDNPEPWKHVKIPVVLIKKEAGEKIRHEISLSKLGMQKPNPSDEL